MRTYLRKPTQRDAKEYVQAARDSVSMHGAWIQPAQTVSDFANYLERVDTPRNRGFLICRKEDDRLVGVVNLNEIIRGALHGAFVGYWGVSGFAGKGYMTEGLAQAIDLAFGELQLHRLEVNIQPGNERSIALAKRLGMRMEGFSPRYLFIAGDWRDHERWAVVKEEWEAVGGAREVCDRIAKGR